MSDHAQSEPDITLPPADPPGRRGATVTGDLGRLLERR